MVCILDWLEMRSDGSTSSQPPGGFTRVRWEPVLNLMYIYGAIANGATGYCSRTASEESGVQISVQLWPLPNAGHCSIDTEMCVICPPLHAVILLSRLNYRQLVGDSLLVTSGKFCYQCYPIRM